MKPTLLRSHGAVGVGTLATIITMLLLPFPARAQDLDPRAYVNVPVDITVLVAGFSYSHGAVVTDATSPIQDFKATVATPLLGVGRTFSLFGQTAQALVVVPFSWAWASALVKGQDT